MKRIGLEIRDLVDSTLRPDAPIVTWIQFDRAYRVATRQLEQLLAVHGITRTAAAILLVLHAQPDGVELKTLLEVTGILHAGISGALDRLERQGLCTRHSGCNGDKRVVSVSLTKKGHQLLIAALDDYESWTNILIPTYGAAQLLHATAAVLSDCVKK